MNSVMKLTGVIKCENQILVLEHVCGAQYTHMIDSADKEMVGFKSRLLVFTVDGKEIRFLNESADAVYSVLSDNCIDITPENGDKQ